MSRRRFAAYAMLVMSAAISGAFTMTGCGSRESAAKEPTPAERTAQVQRVQSDARMPPQARAAVLRSMQQAKGRSATAVTSGSRQ